MAAESEDRQWQQHDREHEAAEKSHRREHDADQRALDLALTGLDRRLDELNGLRREVITDRSQFMTTDTHKSELNALKVELRGRSDANAARIDSLEKIIDRAEGSLNTWRGIAAFLGVTGIGAVIYAIVNTTPK